MRRRRDDSMFDGGDEGRRRKDGRRATPLFVACEGGPRRRGAAVVRPLCEEVDLEIDENGMETPPLVACQLGHVAARFDAVGTGNHDKAMTWRFYSIDSPRANKATSRWSATPLLRRR